MRVLKWVAVVLLVLIAAGAVAWHVSPWPRVALIRSLFDYGGGISARKLAPHVPAGVATIADLHYREGDPAARLDVFFPARVAATTERLPVVVWVHGGGWIAGHRSDVANYAKILAAHGFTTVALDYALPPQAIYPVPVEEVNAALGYLAANSERLHIDPDRFVLAGDSAGAQLAAQVANIVTSPDYARAMGVVPSIRPAQLAATVLACGAYDMASADHGGFLSDFLGASLWAYIGRRDFKHDAGFERMSVALYLTPQFPATFLTVGNGDPLLPQSEEMAQRLRGLGVAVDMLTFPADYRPTLRHEYQFDLDGAAGKQALQRIVAFLQAHTAKP